MAKNAGNKLGNHKKPAQAVPPPFSKLTDLHKSHYGLTKEVAQCFAQAADVCFDRHHRSPVDLTIKEEARLIRRRHKWRKPTDRLRAAWANKDDATRDGAYSICIASVEIAEGLFAVGRTDTRTGADYFLDKRKNATNLENAFRLEVSGTDAGESEAASRLRQKIQQTRVGSSNIPAFAAVVSFRDAVVLYSDAEL